MILNAKWHPYALNRWIDQQGTHWIIDPSSSPTLVAAALVRDSFALSLPGAALHFNGKGIQDGVNWEYSLRHLRQLRKEPVFYSFACALESVLCGACWPADRIHSIHSSYSSVCPRCHSAPETSLHTFWECPNNDLIDDEAITTTQSLKPAAIANADLLPCFWLRGIVPESLLMSNDIPPPSDSVNINYKGSPVWTSGTYYGDGSGGEYSSHPLVRRCGCGIASVDGDGALVFGLSANLPRPIQTVPRSEYFAFTLLLSLLQPSSVVTFVTDHLPLSNAFNKGKEVAISGINGDLMKQVYLHIEGKNLSVTVRWVKAHTADDVDVSDDNYSPPPGVSLLDVLGNKQADTLAKAGAHSNGPDLNSATRVVFYASLARRIQNRLATIICSLPNRPHRIKTPRQPIVKLDELMHQSSHNCFEVNSRVFCMRCNTNYSCKNKTGLKHWLSSPCPDLGAFHDRPVHMAFDHVHIGNLDVDFSHELMSFKGIVYCNKCGSISQQSKLGKLASPCLPPSQAGLNNLKLLKAGTPPVNINAWPEAPVPPPPAIHIPLNFNQLLEGVDLDGPAQDRINILAQQYDAMLAQVEP